MYVQRKQSEKGIRQIVENKKRKKKKKAMTESKEKIAKGKSCGNETVTETINIHMPA